MIILVSLFLSSECNCVIFDVEVMLVFWVLMVFNVLVSCVVSGLVLDVLSSS